MEENLSRHIYKFIDFDKLHIISLSGGKDSICLLNLVLDYKDKFKTLPEIIHFNHSLRKASDKEEIFIKKLAQKNNLKLNIIRLNVKSFAKKNKYSIEEAARFLRYKELANYTNKFSEKGIIFTGHTASDQAETILFRIIKGTGKSGLSGIRKELILSNGWIIKRPLLDITSDKIIKWLKNKRIKHLTDKSNFNMDIPRNYIRHKIIKKMHRINPSLERSISKETLIWAEEENFLNEVASKERDNLKTWKKNGRLYIELKSILSYTLWLKRRVLKILAPVELDFNRVESLIGLLKKSGSYLYIDIGSGWRARIEYDKLVFERNQPGIPVFAYKLDLQNEMFINETGKTIKASIVDQRILPDNSRTTEIFDADELDVNNIIIRSKKNGDVIKLFGMNGRKKIKDLFIDMKLTADDRNKSMIFNDDNKILWVAPFRRSRIATVTEKTKKVLRIEIK